MSHLAVGLSQGKTLRFLIVGIGGALGFIVGTWALISAGIQPSLAAALAYFLCFCTVYLVQRSWTFRVSENHVKTLPRYAVTQLLCAGLAMATAHAASVWLGSTPLVTAVATSGVSSATSYVLSSRWVFA